MVNEIMSAAIHSVSFHVIRSSTNRNKHLYCSTISKPQSRTDIILSTVNMSY